MGTAAADPTLRFVSIHASRCVAAHDHQALERQIAALESSGTLSVEEPLGIANPRFTQLADISGAGRFTVSVAPETTVGVMCSTSLPLDLLIAHLHPAESRASTLVPQVRAACAQLEGMLLVDYFDLLVASVVTTNGSLPTAQAVRGTRMDVAVVCEASDLVVLRHSAPCGEVLLVITQTDSAAAAVHGAALELARLRGGCRDLILRLRGHRADRIGPLLDSVYREDADSTQIADPDSLRRLVDQRHTLFGLDRDFDILDQDWDCLSEYETYLAARLRSNDLSRRALSAERRQLINDEIEPLKVLLRDVRRTHETSARYLRDRIDLAYAESASRVSQTVKRLQVAQVALAIALLALGIAQIIQLVQNESPRLSTSPSTTRIVKRGASH